MSPDPQFEVTLYPNPVLRKVAEDVPFDEELEGLVRAMFTRMFESKGVGLAAPQVGLQKRVLVLNKDGEDNENNLALINPKITGFAGPKTTFEEGCLSFPGIYAEVVRPDRCTVEAFDAKGEPINREFEGFESRVIQHEYDHLQGVLLVDRMSATDRMRSKDALEELKERYRAQKIT